MAQRASLCLLLIAFAATLPAQESGTNGGARRSVTAYADYEHRQFHLTVRRPVESRSRNLPAATTRVAESIDSSLVELFGEAILELKVDSLTTVRERFQKDTQLLSLIPELATRYSQRLVRRAVDLSWVEVRYSYELYPTIASLFVSHDRPIPQHRLLRWVPSGPYTGIVIYAQEELPVRGEGTEAYLQAALLPEVYTAELEPILTPLMQPGDMVRARGVLAYTAEVDGATVAARAGDNPMYVMAHEIFGRHDTDIILHRDDSAAILASESARTALRNGKVVVIISEDAIRTD